MIVSADRLWSDGNSLSHGWMRVHGGTVAEVGEGAPPLSPDTHVSGELVPGFTDIHVHGALGIDFSNCTTEEAARVAEFHARHGSTRIIASVASGTLDEMRRAVASLAPLVANGTIEGVHLEGPFLSREYRGAHSSDHLRNPQWDALEFIGGLDRVVRMVTLAPELTGAREIIEGLVSRNITVAIGHSAADAATTSEAIGWGAQVVTHLFNGSRPLHHRDVGIVGVALTDPRLTLELIADGVHISPQAIQLVRAVAAERMVLISDAMAAAGLVDGRYRVAGSPVDVVDGVARTASDKTLAGSTTTVGSMVRRLLAESEMSIAEIITATSVVPRRTLGLTSAQLRVGDVADAVAITEGDRQPLRVIKGGVWLPS